MARQAAVVQPQFRNSVSEAPVLRVIRPDESPMPPLETSEGKLQLTAGTAGGDCRRRMPNWKPRLPRRFSAGASAASRRKFTMATAFGPEGMIILHMLSEIDTATPVFNLDTGYQFKETLELREEVIRRYGMTVELKRAGPDRRRVRKTERRAGLSQRIPTSAASIARCRCWRKRSIGYHAWASAIRRDQSPDRANAPIVGWDKKFGLVKVSPLANWTKKMVWKFITDHNVPYNPLHDQGYTSIGCWPCTRAVNAGKTSGPAAGAALRRPSAGCIRRNASLFSPAASSWHATCILSRTQRTAATQITAVAERIEQGKL